jgi:hypothetical protein
MFAAIQAGAKNIYISKTGTEAIDASTEEYPAPFSSLRTYLLSTYDVKTDSQLNVYFLDGDYDVTTISNTQVERFFKFGSNAKVNGLNVTFLPNTPSNGGEKRVVFNGSGTANTRFIELTGSASNRMTLLIKDVKIQNFKSTASDGGGTSSLFDLVAGSSLTLDDVVIDQIESQQLSFAYQPASSSFTVKNTTLSNIIIAETYDYPIISSAGLLSFENCTLENWKTDNATVISASDAELSLNNCIIRNCSMGGSGKRLIDVSKLDIINCNFIKNNPAGDLLYHKSGTITNSVFWGNTPKGSIIHTNTSNVKKDIVNNLFDNNVVTAPLIYNQNGNMLLSENTFTRNTITGTTLITVANGTTEIHTNSLVNNTANGTLVNFTNGTSVMYNNTLSKNTGATTAIALATANAKVINNTIYNSGNVTITSDSGRKKVKV